LFEGDRDLFGRVAPLGDVAGRHDERTPAIQIGTAAVDFDRKGSPVRTLVHHFEHSAGRRVGQLEHGRIDLIVIALQ
jgi:hypothetical protein